MPIVGHVDRVGDHAGDRRRARTRARCAKQPASASATASSTMRLRGVELLALHLEAAERVDRLRREADVAHHRDLGVEDRRDRVEPLAAALELHRAGARRASSAAALRTVSSRLTW